MGLPLVRAYLTEDDGEAGDPGTERSVFDVAQQLNATRAARGLPPLEVKTLR
jgi:hypothetical protein